MNITLLNALLALNLVASAIFNRNKLRFPLAPFIALLSVTAYSFAVVSVWGDSPSTVWIGLTLSIFFYFFKFIQPSESGQNELDVFLGLMPIYMVYTNDMFTLFLYTVVVLFSRHLLLNENDINESKLSVRFQFLDGFSIITFLVVLILQLAAFNTLNMDEAAQGIGLSSVILPVVLGLLALCFAGFFESGKDEYRNQAKGFNTNLIISEIFLKAFLPGLLIIKSGFALEKLDFEKYGFSQQLLAGLFISFSIIVGIRLWSADKRPQAFYRVYFLIFSAYFLLVLNASEYYYLLGIVTVKTMFVGLTYRANTGIGENIKGVLSYLILPTPVSPIIWLMLVIAFQAEGATSNMVVLTTLISSFIGFLSFNNMKTSQIKHKGSLFHIGPAGLASVTIMTAFFAVLFTVKIVS